MAADNPFAIRHYNRAIKRLLTEPVDNVDSVLTVCVLFICIEFLRGDKKAAINHTRHGIRLLNTRRDNSQLSAVFCYIRLLPLFFNADLLDLPPLMDGDGPSPDMTFRSVLEAKHSLDGMVTRTVWLVRRTEAWQIGVDPDAAPTPANFDEQRDLAAAFDRWGDSFARFQARRGVETGRDPASLALKIRWRTCNIWVRNCLSKGEMMYDGYRRDGEMIVAMARRALEHDKADRSRKFMFDMGFSPLLHFVALKCRHLKLRVSVLALLRDLACPREVLWDASAMQAVGRRVIEVEHGIELSPEQVKVDNDFGEVELPPEKARVRGYVLEDRDEFRAEEGVKVYERPVCFFAFGEDGGLERKHDWVTVYT